MDLILEMNLPEHNHEHIGRQSRIRHNETLYWIITNNRRKKKNIKTVNIYTFMDHTHK